MIDILYKVDGVDTIKRFDKRKFPAGELIVNIEEIPRYTKTKMVVRYEDSDDLIGILLLNNALKNHKCIVEELVIPYFPYSRQDRVCSEGDAFSLEEIAELIDMQCFDKVTTFDMHSNTVSDLGILENFNNVKQHTIWKEEIGNMVESILSSGDSVHLIAPDEGSYKKAEKLSKILNIPVIRCSKVRDTSTGKLLKFDVPDLVDIPDVGILVDDICDGGGTFLGIGEQLKSAGIETLVLCVTHGIFSKGLTKLSTVFDMILSTDSLGCNKDIQKCLPITNFLKD